MVGKYLVGQFTNLRLRKDESLPFRSGQAQPQRLPSLSGSMTHLLNIPALTLQFGGPTHPLTD